MEVIKGIPVAPGVVIGRAFLLEEVLEPKGVGVVVEAKHLCMMMRGVESKNAFAVTSSLRGEFQEDSKTRAEFMELIRHQKDSFA